MSWKRKVSNFYIFFKEKEKKKFKTLETKIKITPNLAEWNFYYKLVKTLLKIMSNKLD